MNTLAMIYWGYLALVLVVVVLLVASPFLIALFRSARAIAHVSSDEFRLSHTHMWTEAHHTNDGGSFELMRLTDDNLVLISVGVTTVKVFLAPDQTDMARYRELKEFPLPNGLERVQWAPHERHSQDLLFLDRVRRTIGWPTSADQLTATLEGTDSGLLLSEI